VARLPSPRGHAQPQFDAFARVACTQREGATTFVVTRPMQIGARRATRDIAVQVLGRNGNHALGVVVTLIVVRGLGARGFGAWSTIFAVTQIASVLGDLGLNQVAISRAAREPERESHWLGALVSLRVALALPVTAVALSAVLVIAPNRDTRIAGVLIAATILVGAPAAVSAAFQLRVRNDITIAIMTLNSVLWAAGAIGVWSLGGGIREFAAAFLLVAVITTCVTVPVATRLVSVRLAGARRLWPALWRVGLGVGTAGILVTGYVRLDQILVFSLAGSRQAGLYGAVYRILDQVQFIPISVMTTLFPLIASAHPGDPARVRRVLQTAGEYLTMASLPILAFTIVAALPIVRLLFGPGFAAAATALPILMGAFVAISFGYLGGNMVVILELQRAFVVYAAVGLVVNAALNVALIPRYGFLAAAWITLLTEVVVTSLTMRRVLSTIEMAPRWGRLVRTLAAAVAMGALIWAARRAGLPLAGLVAIAAVTYPAFLLAVGALSPADLRALRAKEPVRGGGSPS
jgi:O-antigen/teichoic acid export membrane protein